MSFIFLLLEIQMMGVTAMATSKASPGSMNTSKIVVKRLRRNKSILNRKRVMKLVFRETNSTW